MREAWEWVRTYWTELSFIVVVTTLIVVAILTADPSCEELGGTRIQVGTRQETYVVTHMSVGEVQVPIYGTRTVPVYDCVGEE